MIYGDPGAGTVAYKYSLSLPITPPVPGTGIADFRGALAAIRSIGTNGLPFLIRKLQARPPPRLIRLIQRYAGNWPVIRSLFPPRDQAKEQGQAVAGLLVLCPLPPDVERKLRAMSLDFYSNYWYQAFYVLKAQKDPRVIREALSAYEQ